jgi:hypothetical protein
MRLRHRLSVLAGFCLAAQAGVVRAQPVPQSEWPATVRASFQEAAASCREAASGRMTFDREIYVKRADLNGDGRPDYVVDDAGLSCPGAASLLCGSAGCGVAIHLSGPRGYRLAWQGHLQAHELVPGAPPRLRTGAHGSSCGRVGADVCYGELAFSGGRIVYRPMPRGVTGALWMSGSEGWRQDAGTATIDLPAGNVEGASVACVRGGPAFLIQFRRDLPARRDIRMSMFPLPGPPEGNTADHSVAMSRAGESRVWVAHPVDGATVALLTGPAESVGLMSGEQSWNAVPLTGSTRAIRAALASCSGGPPAAGGAAPQPSSSVGSDDARIRSLLASIYDPYLRDPGENGGNVLDVLTPELKRLERLAYGEEGLAADPFCECQDWQNVRYAIQSVAIRGERADARISFSNFGQTALITLRLEKTAAGWRVDDIVGPAGGSWRESIQADMRRRRR